MSIKLNDNFALKSNKPLDARLVFNTYDEMTAYPKKSLYEGVKTYCKETGVFYSLLLDSNKELNWVKDNGTSERNVSIQVPKSENGIVYPEIVVESLLFQGDRFAYVTSVKVISRKPLSENIEFKLVYDPILDESTEIMSGVLEARSLSKTITEFEKVNVSNGYLYIDLTNCNGIQEPLEFIINLKVM